MKFRTTALLGLLTVGIGAGVYFLDFKKQENLEKQKDVEAQIVLFNPDQVNFIEIQKPEQKVVLQKSATGWALLEPIQDQADNEQIENLIKSLVGEKMIAIAKESSNLTTYDLKEYGLEKPLAVFNIKNNAGNSKKIAVGTQKNFEGNAFLRVDAENRVLVGNSSWFNQAQNALIYFREKRFYRHPLAKVDRVQIKSYQDQFELKRTDNKWASVGQNFELDQNKVREVLKKITESSIQEYVFDGEPSSNLLKEAGLIKSPVHIQLSTADSTWSADMNQSEKEKAILAVTDRPTNLVRLDISEWEFFANLNLDALRDRVTLTRFNLDEVKKIYYKTNGHEMSFAKIGEQWTATSPVPAGKTLSDAVIGKVLNHIHDLEISEFLDKDANAFRGTNMLILKTESDRLVYQLNWGPELKLKRRGQEKDYFYARTQIEPQIFAIEKSKIDLLGFDQIFETSKTDVAPTVTEPKAEGSTL